MIAPKLILTTVSLLGLTTALPALDFVHEVAPILKEHCADCHLGTKKKGGFSMNTRSLLIAGSENGAVIEPGHADKGLLLEAVTSDDEDVRMPPKGKRVTPAQVEILRKWIAAGAVWEDGFTFGASAYEPPFKPHRPELPPAVDGRTHPVDRIVDKYLADHKTARPAPVGDAVFFRRLSLDLLGVLPDSREVEQFVKGNAPDKRAKLVETLLSRDTDYAEHWLSFWNDLLRNDFQGTGYIDGGRRQITGWLYEALATNKPYDQFTRELLAPPSDTSDGFINGIKWRGAVNASQVREIQFAQSVSQTFLGINMKCASCHDSFVDRWKLKDAYGLAAIYSDHQLELFRCDKPTGKTAVAAWPFPEIGQVDAKAPREERLKQLAALMTHPENGRFTRTIVNRLWHRLLGRGIVHPVDAMDTAPWSADLLDHLAVTFSDNHYDLRKMLAYIATSQAYQSAPLSSPPPPDPAKPEFRGPVARRLTAEQFVDAVWRLTGSAPSAPHKTIKRETKGGDTEFSGKWIWSYASASSSAPVGETISLRKTVRLDAVPASARVSATCDNAFRLYVNGVQLLSSDDWQEPVAADLTGLKAGENTILVVASNGGTTPNAASFIADIRIETAAGKKISLPSDATWEWSKTVPDAQGKFANEPKDWKPAALLEKQTGWPSVKPALAANLGMTTTKTPVRAGTVPSDLLMRALGRPNREQIVSMRPDNLTTLEAIDLANGAILSNYLKQGAAGMLKSKPTPKALVENVFGQALSRPPTEAERSVALAALGSAPKPEQVEDLLWLVIMLPEFQFVR